ncbi:MAG: DUF1926 domain-containing protein [Deltaproteobacteria bacterium]|nr:MAG: DUF1926 domain-containing protein [Deltaproteobacteria bacterium]
MNPHVLILYLRLPPGSSSEDVQGLVDRVIRPALTALDDAPAVRAGLVCPGEVLNALESEAPAVLADLRERVGDGRLEALATALYEPLFGDIPEEDAVGQVQAHLGQVRQRLGVRPRGLALPWMAWCEVAARVAVRCELDWVLIPEVQGVVSVEHEGSAVRGLGCATIAPHGVLDDRFASVIDLGALGWHAIDQTAREWFAHTLGALASTRLPSESVDAGLPAPRVVRIGTRPGALYRDQWPSSELLHQRVIATSQLVARMARESENLDGPEIDPVTVVQAQRYLWRSQAGDVFVEGDEGGIRSGRQRHRAWRDVLRAERLAMDGLRASRRAGATPVDLDGDGVPEVILRSPDASVRIVPARRGALASFTHAHAALQLGGLPRRTRAEWEAALRSDPTDAPLPGASGEYAASQIIADSVKRRQLYDALREDVDGRVSFDDRFLHAEASLDRFESAELGPTTTGLDGPWEVEAVERAGMAARCVLRARGTFHEGDDSWPVEVSKRYTLRGSELELRYEVQNQGLGVLRTRLLLPLDVSLGPDAEDCELRYGDAVVPLLQTGDRADVQRMAVAGPAGTLTVSSDSTVRLWHHPVTTVHRARGEMTSTVQGVCLGAVWLLQLWARETAAITLKMSFEPS